MIRGEWRGQLLEGQQPTDDTIENYVALLVIVMFVVAKSSGQELVIIARCYQMSISPPQVTQKPTKC